MGMIGRRRVVGGFAAAMLAAGVFGALAASTGAAGSVALPRTLGFVGSVSASVRLPVGARMVVVPSVTYNVQNRVLRLLAARNPRVTARFRARIVTAPKRGKGRTLIALSRTLKNRRVVGSSAGSMLGAPLSVARFTLSREQTAAIKRAARRGSLRIISTASFTVRFTTRTGRTAVVPGIPWTFSRVLYLKAPKLGGGNLHQLDVALRKVISQAQRLPMACVTRNAIIRRLRIADSALVSGRRSAAAGLLSIWIARARSMRASGLLSVQQATTLQNGLRAILPRVGTGFPRKLSGAPRWPALPSCGGAAGAATSYQPFDASDAEWIVYAMVNEIPVVGNFLAALVEILWPSTDTNATVNNLINQAMSGEAVRNAQAALGTATSGLEGALNLFVGEEACCTATDPDVVKGYFISAHTAFTTYKGAFTDPSYAVTLLPLYAQYENLYLSLLREGVIAGLKWTASQTQVNQWETDLKTEMAEANKYVTNTYKLGHDKFGTASDPYTLFNKTVTIEGIPTPGKNAWEREYQREVLDYQQLWKFLDPQAYSFGDPNFKLISMVYSDAVGQPDHDNFAPPLDVASEQLTHLKVGVRSMSITYTTPCNQAVTHKETWTGSHIVGADVTNGQFDSGWQGGTAAVTQYGDYDVASNSTLGPITSVQASSLVINPTCSAPELIGMTLGFSHGGSASLGSGGDRHTFAYSDQVLANARIMGYTYWGPSDQVADSIVFGFRYGDSFYPSGEVQSVGTPGKCLDLPSWGDGITATLSACRSTPSGAQDWTYNSSTRALMSSGGPANGGLVCLQARAGGTAEGTSVQAYHYHCGDPNVPPTPAQQWLVSSDGTIINVGSWMCLKPTSTNTDVWLTACTGSSAAEHWTTPWTTRLPGTLRAPDTKACLDVTGGSRSDGTPLEMYSCNGGWQQTWQYDTASALRVYGGTKCMTPDGGTPFLHDTLVASDCNGATAQKWTMNSDGTIANKQAPTLCLQRLAVKYSNGAAFGVPVNSDGSAVAMITCSTTTQDQKWASPEG